MGQIGQVKPGGLQGNEIVTVKGIDGVSYIATLQNIIDQVGGGGPCITGDALISINENETVRFDQLAIRVLTYNKETEENEVQVAREVITKEHTDLVKITLDNGTVLKCTAAHPWMSDLGWVSLDVEGSKTYYGVDAVLLSTGSKLQIQDGAFALVTEIETFSETQTTYHLAGISNGNYYANGVLTASMK